jgi:hypothetical protein
MKKYFETTNKALNDVYKDKWYIVLSVAFALLVFLFNALITNYSFIFSGVSLTVILGLIWGFIINVNPISVILVIVMSILSGIVFSQGVYQIKRQVSLSTATGFSSVLLSVVAPSCPACAIGLLSVLGVGGILTVLPFKGLELGILGVVLLVVAIVYLSGKITTKTCKISK